MKNERLRLHLGVGYWVLDAGCWMLDEMTRFTAKALTCLPAGRDAKKR